MKLLTQHCPFLFAITFLALYYPLLNNFPQIWVFNQLCAVPEPYDGKYHLVGVKTHSLPRLSCPDGSNCLCPLSSTAELTCYSSSPVTVAENSEVFKSLSGLWHNLSLSVPSQRKSPQWKFFPCTSLSRPVAYPPPLSWILIQS